MDNEALNTRSSSTHSDAEYSEVAQPQCNPHPDAPHGFDRNASHSADRYVCECESWAQQQVSDYDREFWGDGQDHSEQHLNMAQCEWVDLTADEIKFCSKNSVDVLDFAAFVIAKFKEKNTPPVAPQGEPVGYIPTAVCRFLSDNKTTAYAESQVWNKPREGYQAVYASQPSSPNLNCKSVQRRLATSWGYVRKEEYDMARVAAASQMRDAAVKLVDDTPFTNWFRGDLKQAIAALPIPHTH